MMNIDHLTKEELRELLSKMSPEAARQYRQLNKGAGGLLASNLREMDSEENETDEEGN